MVHSSFKTLLTYSFLKSFTSNLPPVKLSASFIQILAAKHTQAITKKNNVCKWNPLKWSSYCVYLITPAIKGNTPRARFWTTSIIPNPVPKRLGLTIIGTVGTITVQKMAIQTPNKAVGTHLIHSIVLRSTLVSRYIIKM